MEPLTNTPANCLILNNSPALHSLKRQQLIQLCKRNGIKATGKNSDIIEKLKAHALKVPEASSGYYNAVLSSDDETDKENRRIAMPRPSETWTVIEEDSDTVERMQSGLRDIREEVEQEMLNRSSLRGFGTANSSEFGNGTTSSKGSSMTLSLKAFASTFKLSKLSTAPSSVLPGPATMPVLPGLTTPPRPSKKPSPLPSPATIDGNESFDQSILEMGEQTIRLVTSETNLPSPPALRPFTPTFEAVFSPESVARIKPYPSLSELHQDDGSDPCLPGGFNATQPLTPKPKAKVATAAPTPASPPPVVFGSPAARISNTQFNSAAQTVLAEMNARLGLTGTSNEVGLDILQKRNTETPVSIFTGLNGVGANKTEISDKFDRAHEREFQKMEGIGDWYAKKVEPVANPSQPLSKKRKSDVLTDPHRRPLPIPPNAKTRRVSRVVTPATRKSLAAAAEHEEMDAQERRVKRVKISNVDGGDAKPRKTEEDSMEVDDPEEAERIKQRERERAAIKKKLEVSRARRRSSAGKVAVGANTPALIPNKPKKGMTTKFGFLSSAKSLVKSVWNMGAGSSNSNARTNDAKPTVLTKPNPAVKPQLQPAPKPSLAPSRPSGLLPKPNGAKTTLRVPSGSRKPSVSNSTKLGTVSSTKTTSRLSTTSTSSAVSGIRRGAIPSFSKLPDGRISRGGSIASGPRTVSSTGTGTSGSRLPANSIGLRKPSGPVMGSLRSSGTASSQGSINAPGTGFVRQRTSTLLAPTASSLAKMQGTVKAPSLSGSGSARPSVIQEVSKPGARSPVAANSVAFASFAMPMDDVVSGTEYESTRVVGTPMKSPRRIFNNGTPSFAPVRSPVPTQAHDAEEQQEQAQPTGSTSGNVEPRPRIRTLSQKSRPRISRSRVIARVGAQRAAAAGASNSDAKPAGPYDGRRSLNAPRPRSSLAKAGLNKKRQSMVTSAARKRMRQSEVMRRSRGGSIGVGVGMTAGVWKGFAKEAVRNGDVPDEDHDMDDHDEDDVDDDMSRDDLQQHQDP